MSQGQSVHVWTEKRVAKVGQQFSSSVPKRALRTCNNEKSIHHLEESIGQGEADHLDQLLGSERELQHGEAHLNILGPRF